MRHTGQNKVSMKFGEITPGDLIVYPNRSIGLIVMISQDDIYGQIDWKRRFELRTFYTGEVSIEDRFNADDEVIKYEIFRNGEKL